MKIALAEKIKKEKQDLVIACFDKEELKSHKFFGELSDTDKKYVLDFLNQEKNRFEKIFKIIFLPQRKTKLFIVGLGDKKTLSASKADNIIRKIVLTVKELKVDDVALLLKDFSYFATVEDELKRAVINISMADFVFNKYKETPKDGWPEIGTLSVIVSKIDIKTKTAFEDGLIIGEETNNCRSLSNIPGGDMTPRLLAEAALFQSKISNGKIKIKILDEKEMTKLNMGGVLGVGKGSKEKPCFIIMEYLNGKKSENPLVFVGKGVTFDSGGINLKLESDFEEMHMDMSGGAAVIHAITAIAKLKLNINVIGLIPAVENMLSGESLRPGDILRTMNGKTIEVINTDAEGRIILADALQYAVKYNPKLIVDVATLTGSAMVALGQRFTAVFTTNKDLEILSREAGEASGDEVWPLPLSDEYNEDIKGTFGDLANIAKTRYGGAIVGAVFLKQFVDDYPWIHLDIAPTMTTIKSQNLIKGASGVGVRFLVELTRKFEKIEK